MQKIIEFIKGKMLHNKTEKDVCDQEKQTDDIYEICVACGKITEVLKSTPIYQRDFYISGAGQVCRDCYYDLDLCDAYDSNHITEKEMKDLLNICQE